MTLAKSGDPYIGTDGKLIEQTDLPQNDAFNTADKRKVMPAFSNFVPTKALSIDNLPEPEYQQQTVICAIVGLKLLGLSPGEIGEITGTSLETIQNIVKSPAAQVTFEKVFQNLIHANSESAQGRIASHATRAVDVVLDMMEDEDVRDDVRLKAAQDVLDRSGTHPDQFFADTTQNNQADDELRIVFMDESGEKEKVKVEIKKG